MSGYAALLAAGLLLLAAGAAADLLLGAGARPAGHGSKLARLLDE